ncbi:MAG: hypothetical protein QXQ47_02265 [Candidatus Bathyarchaeia archaeon]
MEKWKQKKKLLELGEERLMELEHSRLIVESLKLELRKLKRREKMAREIVRRRGWRHYIV